MTDYYKQFCVKPNADIRLKDIDPDFKGAHISIADAKEEIKHNTKRLRELQELLYSEHKRSLLICLQAMDAGGKDGVIRHVLGAMNPQGCNVYPFRKPNNVELDHDFMWRAYRHVPAKGEIAIFNRSHYEDVLAVRVHKLIPKDAIARRYDEINAIEKHWSDNNTHILKFFLHISKDEQLSRFKDRLDNPAKHWKISENDYTERQYWKDYMQAFEIMFSRCSKKYAPWFVIPANHKWFRDLAISQIMVRYLEGLKMKSPEPAVNIAKIRKEYHQAKKGG
jgi:PPK2 family polyphosphate:nucleotide phosphotransferase